MPGAAGGREPVSPQCAYAKPVHDLLPYCNAVAYRNRVYCTRDGLHHASYPLRAAPC